MSYRTLLILAKYRDGPRGNCSRCAARSDCRGCGTIVQTIGFLIDVLRCVVEPRSWERYGGLGYKLLDFVGI